mmetsp:Transcript_16760/g.43275  ORF Transcript_16760/g.43275 Transcript_16760/m.43275 type:complete len:88 (-) Transcript_16760:68-331(-)
MRGASRSEPAEPLRRSIGSVLGRRLPLSLCVSAPDGAGTLRAGAGDAFSDEFDMRRCAGDSPHLKPRPALGALGSRCGVIARPTAVP